LRVLTAPFVLAVEKPEIAGTLRLREPCVEPLDDFGLVLWPAAQP
jgi:hypothetical protein